MPTNNPWDGTAWDVTAPDIDQLIGNHYKEMFDLRKGVGIRMDKEHIALATSSAGGEHVQGSARMWSLPTASIPNLQPDGTALVITDNGMTWHDTTTDILYLLDDFSDPTIGNGWLSLGLFLGDIDVGASKFTVDAATGNTLIGGTLDIQGTTAVSGILDEDDLVSDSATDLVTQQSVKAYVDERSPAGGVMLYAGASEPAGWKFCNGQTLDNTGGEFDDLWDSFGSSIALYGGTDQTSFNVPDLRGRTPIGVGTGDASDATAHALADKEGTEGVTLTSAQSGVPAHNHPVGIRADNSGASGKDVRSGNTGTDLGNVTNVAVNNTAANAASAHSSLQPSLTLNVIIKY